MIREKIRNNLDLVISVLGVVSGVITLILGFKIANVMIQQISLVLILAPMIYILVRNTFQTNEILLQDNSIIPENSYQKFLCSSIIFQILLIFAIILSYFGGNSHSLLFLIVISIMAGVLAVSIFFATTDFQFLLAFFEIFTLGVFIRATAYFQFPTMIGADPWLHCAWIQSLSITGNIQNSLSGYESFPIMHLISTIFHFTINLTIKESMFFVGICEVIGLIFLFLIIRKIFNKKIALLAVLLQVLSASNIAYGYQIIPQTLGFVYIVMLLYLVFTEYFSTKKLLDSKVVRYRIIMFIIFLALLYTHTISTFAFIIFLLTLLIIDILYAHLVMRHLKYSSILLFYIVLFGCLLVQYWFFVSNFKNFIIYNLEYGFSSASFALPVTTISADFVTAGMTQLPLYLIVFFAIIGSLYYLKRENLLKCKNFFPFIFFGWGIVIFIFLCTFLQLNNFLPGRWLIFACLVLSLPLTISLSFCTNIFSQKNLGIFLIVTVFALVMATNYEANATNVNPWTPYPTQGLKESEISAAIFSLSYIPENTNIYTDNYFIRSFRNGKNILSGDPTLVMHEEVNGVFLLRDEIRDNVFFSQVGTTGHQSKHRIDSVALNQITKGMKILDTGTVDGYSGFS